MKAVRKNKAVTAYRIPVSYTVQLLIHGRHSSSGFGKLVHGKDYPDYLIIDGNSWYTKSSKEFHEEFYEVED